MADQCLEQHVIRNPEGGQDIRSFCTRLRRHARGVGEWTRWRDHFDENTGQWWDEYGYDRTDEHAPDEAPHR